MAVDYAYNVTIIPNPEKPIDANGTIVGWWLTLNLTNYRESGDEPTFYLQLWRCRGVSGSMTTFQLLGQTVVTANDEEGHKKIDLKVSDRLEAFEGDLIGISMTGPGCLSYYRNISDTKCVFVGDRNTPEMKVGSTMNFSSVWFDDWTYDVEAILEPVVSGM